MASDGIYRAGWTLDDIDWSRFDATKVDPTLLKAVKAASLVEYNAQDYVAYLSRVFPDDPVTKEAIEHWGVEEVQHGQALARWAEMADPSWSFEAAFARFRKGYRPAHFDGGEGSIRGSRVGELVARCVVECGTSSYYTAMKEAAAEPVLQEVAGRIAADEFRHYKLFYDLMDRQPGEKPGFWRRAWIAATRMNEAEDDELSYAYYAANVPPTDETRVPYERKRFAAAYHATAMRLYRKPHITRAVSMMAKAVGAKPQGRIVRALGDIAWSVISRKAKSSRALAQAA